MCIMPDKITLYWPGNKSKERCYIKQQQSENAIGTFNINSASHDFPVDRANLKALFVC